MQSLRFEEKIKFLFHRYIRKETIVVHAASLLIRLFIVLQHDVSMVLRG